MSTRQIFHLILPLPLLIAGLFCLLFGFAWASLIPPTLEGWAWWREYLRHLGEGGLILPILLGLGLLALAIRSTYLAILYIRQEAPQKR